MKKKKYKTKKEPNWSKDWRKTNPMETEKVKTTKNREKTSKEKKIDRKQ